MSKGIKAIAAISCIATVMFAILCVAVKGHLFYIIASIWFNSFWVFLITSVAGALFDLMFVIMQRYNRPRVIRMAKRSA